MKLRIIQIGKTKESWLNIAIAEYVKRLKPYVSLTIQELSNISNRKVDQADLIMEKEAKSFLSVWQEKDYNVVLDESGIQLSSLEFAEFISKNTDTKQASFFIGGIYGTHPSIRQKADCCLGLSRMTLTHQMVRLLLIEQLYRSITIINNRSYHY